MHTRCCLVEGLRNATGQQETIQRVLSQENTLYVSATGSGKSLTYLLPTLLWKRARASRQPQASQAWGLTLVVSPLLALIRDQLHNLPAALAGACLSSDMTRAEQARVSQLVHRQQIDVLYIAPERLLSSQFMQDMAKVTSGGASPLQLLVVDEAHCTSSWAANFRPALLRLERVFQEELPVCAQFVRMAV